MSTPFANDLSIFMDISIFVGFSLQEKEQARLEVQDVQTALQELEAKEQQETAEKQKLQT
jgi:hypothetical protein